MATNFTFSFIFIGLLVNNVLSYNPMLTYTLRFKKIDVQSNFTTKYLTIDQYKDTQFINGKVSIDSKELINKVIAVFYRCDPDGIDCEYFQSWEFQNICEQLKQKNQVWTRWYSSFHPPLVCPIDKVNYEIINGTFDIRPAILWYPQVTDYQWEVIQKFYAGDIFVGSYSIEVSFFGYRKKNKSIRKP